MCERSEHRFLYFVFRCFVLLSDKYRLLFNQYEENCYEFSSFYYIDKNRFELRKFKNNFLGTD